MSLLSRHFHGGRKERYYMEERDPFDEYREKDAITTMNRPSHTSITTETSAGDAQIDWKETSEAHVFKLELPGVKKKDVKVEVEDDRVLCITGEKIIEKEHTAGAWHRVERSCGKIVRRISMPEDADVDRVKADMNGGVLCITVPKRHFRRGSCTRSVVVTGY